VLLSSTFTVGELIFVGDKVDTINTLASLRCNHSIPNICLICYKPFVGHWLEVVYLVLL
jgi:hypothetical protein